MVASRNKLIGNILVELGKLVKLENLEIAHDNLTGHLPTSLGNVSTLQDINLEGNYLEGGLQVTLGFLKSLPVSLGYSLPNLRGIHIGGNYFSGTLPVSLSNASKLQTFDISYNHFSGSVSTSFGNAHNLTCLNMESNDLGGENHITGTIPLGIVNLVNLIGIGLAENRLTGTIPDSLGMLKKLQTLYLGGKRDLNCGCGHVFGRVAFIVVADKTDAIAVTAGIAVRYCRNWPLPVKLRLRFTAIGVTPLHTAIFSSRSFEWRHYRYIAAAIPLSDRYLHPWVEIL
ncbi:hypothetical protein GOBAR_AA38367 [Gossypium barbadense]|uniref:Leucine-rich repeat-containing N-terminal plant-type domain-containing protein n=1 Tax=Gossypium barbadense TaxID=3634 RepID=A0A2P5VU39_GOSBA|nr:hypothetical protein GOBAR_AA38367 [Gossypium barbadense]